MEKRKVSIIIPALNEESGLKKTLYSIPKAAILELGYDLEILVIDGNSTDQTRDVAKELSARIIVEERNGYGRAYKTGFSAATGDIIVTLDADGTYPAELIPDYIVQLTASALDFITVNRFSSMEPGSMSITHKFGNLILSTVMRCLYSVDVQDSQSGMWVMHKSFVDKIDLLADDMSLSEEIKIIAFKFFKAVELNGKYFNRTGSAKLATFKHGWKNLIHLFQYRKSLKLAVPLVIHEIEISEPTSHID
jgi:glycosyltransferase involved in cell wall biosynthesis